MEILERISEKTGCSLEWLRFGTGSPYPLTIEVPAGEPAGPSPLLLEDTSIQARPLGRGRSVPIVGLVHAGDFYEACDGDTPVGAGVLGYVTTDTPGRMLFAVRVEGDSMEPEFRQGDFIIVNPELEVRTGDFVIVKLLETEEVTFKKLVLRDQETPRIILRALNEKYEKDLILAPPHAVQFIGRVVERKTLY